MQPSITPHNADIYFYYLMFVSTVPSYDPSGYAGLTPRSSTKDYTKLLPKTEKEGLTTVDENDLDENKSKRAKLLFSFRVRGHKPL